MGTRGSTAWPARTALAAACFALAATASACGAGTSRPRGAAPTPGPAPVPATETGSEPTTTTTAPGPAVGADHPYSTTVPGRPTSTTRPAPAAVWPGLPVPTAMAWRRTTIPTPPGGTQGYAWSALACSSALQCVIGGSEGPYQSTVVDSTANGGRTWTTITAVPQGLGGGVDSAACGPRACWMAAENRTVTASALGRSTDGGRTWIVVADPPGWARRSVTPSEVACSATTCLVYGDNVLSGAPGRFPANLVTAFAATSDGGARWRPIPVPGAGQVDSLTCIRAGRCWALYGFPGGLEHVATTADSGTTWQTVGSLRIDVDHVTGFGCADARACYLLDDSDTLTASGDGGQTWQPADPPRDVTGSTDFSTDTLGCTPAAACWVVSSEQQSAWIGTRSP